MADAIGDIENRSYQTYKARLVASERLSSRNRAWNTALLSLTVGTTFASVGLLVEADLYGSRGDVMFLCLAILSLVASLVVSSLNYGGRSRDMFVSYRQAQRIAVRAEQLGKSTPAPSATAVDELTSEYNSLLDGSENQTTADHHKALDIRSKELRLSQSLTLAPYISLVVPIGILIPLVKWILRG